MYRLMLTRELLEQNLSVLSKLSAPMACSLHPITGADCFYSDGLASNAMCKLELRQDNYSCSYYIFYDGRIVANVGPIPYSIRDFLLELTAKSNELKNNNSM